MVHSVMAISSAGKVKRDSSSSIDTRSDKEQSDHLFSQVLDEKIEEQKNAPLNCHTITYGHDSRLHTFQYQTREYHY